MKLRCFELIHFDNFIFSLFFNVFCFLGLFFICFDCGCALFLSFTSSSFIEILFYFVYILSLFFLCVSLYFLFSFYENNLQYRALNCSSSPDLQSLDNEESIIG